MLKITPNPENLGSLIFLDYLVLTLRAFAELFDNVSDGEAEPQSRGKKGGVISATRKKKGGDRNGE